jgi:hypothetical protein
MVRIGFLSDYVLLSEWCKIDDRTALQPTFGKANEVFNVKWVFLTALSLFEGLFSCDFE